MTQNVYRDLRDTTHTKLSPLCSRRASLRSPAQLISRAQRLKAIAMYTHLASLCLMLGCLDTVVLSEESDEKSGGISAGGVADFPGAPDTPRAGDPFGAAGTSTGIEAGTSTGIEAGTSTGIEAGVEVEAGTGAVSCLPGERLGLCLECAPGNTTRVPREDEECPQIDCDAMSSYDLIGDTSGYVECRLISRGPGESMCQYENVCYQEPEAYCTALSEEVVLTSNDLDECFEIAGCRDDIEPEQVPATGASCNGGRGVCNDLGECEDVVTCESMVNLSYNAVNVVCEDRLAIDNSCDYYANSRNNPWRPGQNMNCNEFCSSLGGSCVSAWGEDNDTCNKTGSKNCSDRFEDTICRCSP